MKFNLNDNKFFKYQGFKVHKVFMIELIARTEFINLYSILNHTLRI